MVHLLEAGHGSLDPFPQFLGPLEPAGDAGHVLVDGDLAPILLSGHLGVVDLLGMVQVQVHHRHQHRVLLLKVLLDQWTLQKGAHDVKKLGKK